MALKQITWRPGLTLPQDPQDSEVYRWDLSDWLDAPAESLVNPPTITADAGISVTIEAVGTTYVDIRVAGGAANKTYLVAVRATSAPHGRVIERTIRFSVEDL